MTYEEIAQRAGLDQEWAERFKGGYEYGASDILGQRLLRSMYPNRYNAEHLRLYGEAVEPL